MAKILAFPKLNVYLNPENVYILLVKIDLKKSGFYIISTSIGILIEGYSNFHHVVKRDDWILTTDLTSPSNWVL